VTGCAHCAVILPNVHCYSRYTFYSQTSIDFSLISAVLLHVRLSYVIKGLTYLGTDEQFTINRRFTNLLYYW